MNFTQSLILRSFSPNISAGLACTVITAAQEKILDLEKYNA